MSSINRIWDGSTRIACPKVDQGCMRFITISLHSNIGKFSAHSSETVFPVCQGRLHVVMAHAPMSREEVDSGK